MNVALVGILLLDGVQFSITVIYRPSTTLVLL